jgi:hypothetical protein
MAAGVIAQGGQLVNGLDARTVLKLVAAYKTAQDVRRQALCALTDHDLELTRNYLGVLPDSAGKDS